MNNSLRQSFSASALAVLRAAEAKARQLNCAEIHGDHVGLALLACAELEGLFEQLSIDRERIATLLERRLGELPRREPRADLGRSDNLRLLGVRAKREAIVEGRQLIEPRHLLLAALNEEAGELTFTKLLHLAQVDTARLRAIEELEPQVVPATTTPSSSAGRVGGQLLASFGQDMTEMARAGLLDPVVGREAEIERLIQTLSRRGKNSPALVGDSGVGKTAVVEGLAQRIVEGRVPPHLSKSRIVSLAVGALVSGTSLRGEFEERIDRLLTELASEPDVIIFIDELHLLIGAGATGEGAMDAASLMKPALARGAFKVIGATTLDEYRRYVERDAALERRFQPIYIDEPSSAETLNILEILAPRYATFHGVEYLPEALHAAVELSQRYLPERRLPDKAIDLLDESGTRTSLRAPDLRAEGEAANCPPQVNAETVAEVIASWTGVPAARQARVERARLSGLAGRLERRLFGQSDVIANVSAAVSASQRPLFSRNGPSASLYFLGPRSVGKATLARVLAEELFGSAEHLLQLEMSEYGDGGALGRLLGSPAGVAQPETGRLSEPMRRRPYQLVFINDLELAHPEVRALFEQILGEGLIKDRAGRTISFRHALLIFASTLPISRPLGFGAGVQSAAGEHSLRKLLGDQSAERMLRALDEIVVFNALGEMGRQALLERKIGELSQALASEQLHIQIGAELRREILLSAEHEGAGGLIRAVARLLERPISTALLDGPVPGANCLFLQRDGDGQVRAQLRTDSAA